MQLKYLCLRHEPILADRAKLVLDLPILDPGEDSSIHQPQCIPLGSTLCLKVPEKPTLCFGLESCNLRLDVLSRIVLESLRPLIDVILETTVANLVAIGKGAIISRTTVKAIKVSCTIGHCASPLSNYKNRQLCLGKYILCP